MINSDNKTSDIEKWFNPLHLEDIDESIDLNLEEWSYDLIKFKQLKEAELFVIERSMLRDIYDRKPLNFINYVQAQNLREQIAHITNRILRGDE